MCLHTTKCVLILQMLNALAFDSPVHVALWSWLCASGMLQSYIDRRVLKKKKDYLTKKNLLCICAHTTKYVIPHTTVYVRSYMLLLLLLLYVSSCYYYVLAYVTKYARASGAEQELVHLRRLPAD